MLLRDFMPDPRLAEFVQCFRIAHFEFSDSNQTFFKAYPPKPEVCLHFILKGRIDIACAEPNTLIRQFPVTLIGQQTAVLPRYNSNMLLNFQVVFQPAAMFILTGIPAYELTNAFIDAAIVFPHSRFALEQMQAAGSYQEILTIAEQFVLSVIRSARHHLYPLDSVASTMIKRPESFSIEDLAREAFLCTKQFERKFYEHVGVNPKTFARIIRFNRAFNTRNANPKWDWLRIAAACDYTDYQHLVKEYKHFTNHTPTAFHLLEQHSPECKLGLSAELYKSRFLPV